MPAIAEVDWEELQDALRQAVPRVTTLLRSLSDSHGSALGQWSVADVATHLSHAWEIVPGLARGEGASPIRDLWDLGALTTSRVDADPERDLTVLADRIDARAAEFLPWVGRSDPDEPMPWLIEDVRAPRRLFACHLLNESLVHGYDIARAAGRPWAIDSAHAALVLMGFIFASWTVMDPRTMVDQSQAADLVATYDVRLRGGGRVFLVFDHGALVVEGPSSRRVDCHLSADPTGMLLVGWNRVSQWEAIRKGQLLAWGRKPWLGLRLRAILRNP